MLINRYTSSYLEGSTDEAGAGSFAGAVAAASVILPPDFYHKDLNDSKKVSPKNRDILYDIIKKEAIKYSINFIDADVIDDINILQARFKAMDNAIKGLYTEDINYKPEHVLIDGNRFYSTYDIPFTCIVKGDGLYTSIAASSILAKVERDNYMIQLHNLHPEYDWISNKGYGTPKHIEAIKKYGITQYHRKSFLKNLEK